MACTSCYILDKRGESDHVCLAQRKNMDHLVEQLCRRGVIKADALRYLQHARTFDAQVQCTFAPVHASGVIAALELMVELHIDQARRPDGTLYIEHPLAVASQVLDAMVYKDPEVVIAALLHDAVENQAAKLARGRPSSAGKSRTLLALEAIEEYTQSARVKDMVAGLSNPDFAVHLAYQGIEKGVNEQMYTLARNALYAEHVSQAIRDPDRALIKLFDLVANALTLDAIPDVTTRTRLLRKYVPVLAIMLDRLQETARPLNITAHRREQLLTRLSDELHRCWP
jgi:(p)ppGpp synthase/HD superfamily hydrolase